MGSSSRITSVGSARFVVVTLGGLYLALALGRILLQIPGGTPLSNRLLESLLVGGPGLAILYGVYRLPQTDMHVELYPFIVRWCFAGFGVMLGVVVLVDLATGIDRPVFSVTLATALGSVGGLGMGTYNARAKARAREAEQHTRELQRYETLIEEATDVNAVLNPDGTFRYLTPSVEHVLGYAPDELVGEIAFEYMHPDDRGAVMDAFAEMVESGGMSRTVVFRFKHANSGWVVLEGRARNLLDDPVIDGVAAYTHDVTEREQLEDDLRQERNLRKRIVETSPIGITVIDADGTLSFANKHAAEIIGFPRDELIGREVDTSLFETTNADGTPVEEGVFEQVRSTGDPVYNAQRQVTHADGQRIWLSVNGAPLHDSSGDMTGVVFAAEDITERKEWEHRLEQQNEQLDSFAGMLAHELRNPLTIAQIYQQQAATGDEDAAIEVETALNRIEEMIDVLLITARGADSAIDWEDVALAKAAMDAWSDVSVNGAELVVESEQTIQADPVHLRHLLGNLFKNSIEHGEKTGTVRVGDLTDGFYVADDGRGIPKDAREDVFKAGHTTDADGIGLGLAFIAQLAETYGWDCTLTESEAGGARFEFTGVDCVEPA